MEIGFLGLEFGLYINVLQIRIKEMINYKTIIILSVFVVLGAWLLPKSSLVKNSNREFIDGDKNIYLHNLNQERKCFLTDRFSSTVRRSDSINNVKKNNRIKNILRNKL